MKFSTVIITKNEADNIERTIRAVQQVCEDIVVVDSGSTDDTISICRRLGVRVFEYEWKGYSANKNFGAAQAQFDWILSIDADEVLSAALIQTLQNLHPQQETVYAIDILTNYCGQWIRHSGWYPCWRTRLYHRQEVRWNDDLAHEGLLIPTHFKEKRLQGIVEHYSYKSYADHDERIERYAQLSAKNLYLQKKKPSWVKLYLGPPFRFFRTLVLKLGFLDGKAGWIISRKDAYLVYRKYRLLRNLWLNP